MSGASSKEQELAPGTAFQSYTVVRPLGSGQMGDVYEANAADGRRVALKVLRTDVQLDAGVRERFLREAKICADIRSPHIVPVLDHGVHQGRPFLVMPVLSGSDLETWLERVGPLRPDVAATIALQVCTALSVAHARGVVHRDLKPANIFLSEGQKTFSAIVCDFGVAKVVDEEGALTASGAVLGTPLYMAPEQLLDSKRVDRRCDVWAVGMTLFHMLSGRTALGEVKTLADLVLALSTGDLVPLQTAAPWIAPSLARVVHAALLPRDRRFQQVDDLASALRRWGPTPAEITAESLVGPTEEMRGTAAPKAPLPKDHAELGTPDDATVAQPTPSTTQPDKDPLVGKVLGGKYRLERRLGAGGMGAVYEGVDGEGTRTAVKVMLGGASRDEDGLRRFTREMRAVRAIDSSHVVKPVDFGVDDKEGIPYFVMELLKGQDLASLIGTIGSLAPAVAAELFVQACEALEAAHRLGIVHRDIKPSNLFLHEPGDGTVVLKVCDFGIAKRIESDVLEASTELTRTGGLLGSPIYMSPEHAKNAKNVDARSDVWSLGLSLHEALTGLRPWRSCTSVGEVIVAICTETVPSLAEHAPWVDPGLGAAITRSLERDASRRWPSIAAFAEALGPHRLGRPVRVEDLASVDDADRHTSARAASVLPPGLVTSGSVKASARPALDASVSLPIEGRGGWRWAAGLAVAALAIGGGVMAVRGQGVEVSRGAAVPASASAPIGAVESLAPPAPSSAASIAPIPASASALSGPAVAASAVASASSSVERRRAAPRPVTGAATPSASAVTNVAAAPARPTSSTASSVGRGFTATDLPQGN